MGRAPSISSAIVVWVGWGTTSHPSRDVGRLVSEFGEDATHELLPQLHEIEKEFYSSDARLVATDLVEMAEMAKARFRNLHPSISDEAINALAWCYTYDYK